VWNIEYRNGDSVFFWSEYHLLLLDIAIRHVNDIIESEAE
jgi:hypothetical protein